MLRSICILAFFLSLVASAAPGDRLRLLIETDAGGDPDDEQSLVRFLLYVNEWDIEGIIANRPKARDIENLNSERTGLGIVRRLLRAYSECYTNLVQHDSRYPSLDYLWKRTVAGYDDTEDAVNLVIAAVDKPDPRPLWYSDWGTDASAATNNLKRALDRIRRERSPAAYAQFKQKLRLTSYDKFAEHTTTLDPPFPLLVNTFQPELDKRRWYHRFSALTAKAGGFNLTRDVLTGHGPLGALYPTNTTHWQKEGDTMTFLYLVPTGMNNPNEPTWGSWAGRHGLNENFPGKPYYWANQRDVWNGTTNRDNTLARWAAHLQNDFRARLDWCVRDFAHANHPPVPKVLGQSDLTVSSGEQVELDASQSTDPDHNALRFQWLHYPEPGTYRGAPIKLENPNAPKTSFLAPTVASPQTIHILLILTDDGAPPLTRYARRVITVTPKKH